MPDKYEQYVFNNALSRHYMFHILSHITLDVRSQLYKLLGSQYLKQHLRIILLEA